MSRNIWHSVNRNRATYTRAATRRTRKALKEQLEPVYKLLRGGEIPTTQTIDVIVREDAIKDMMADIHFAVGKKFGAAVFKSFQKARIGFDEDVYMNHVINMINGQGAVMITGITQATKNRIKAVIIQEVKRGEDINSIALEVSKKLRSSSFVRAITIARTEVIRASNAGALTGAAMTGLPMKKEWISTQDLRTREEEFNHVVADGQKVGLNDMFLVSGEYLDHPASFDGSAGNTINCRCTLGFTRD